MRLIFMLLAAFFIAVMAATCIFLRRKRTRLSTSLIHLNIGGIVSTVLYVLSIQNYSYTASMLLNGIYYASIHWLLAQFLYFTFVLTEISTKSKAVLNFCRVWGIFILLDTISLVSNVFTHYAFTLSPLVIDNRFICWKARYFWPFDAHLVFSYILVLVIIFLLVRKTLMANKFYRKKYLTILLLLMLVIAINAVFLLKSQQFDYSLLSYCFFSLASAYYAAYSTPQKIQNAMLSLVSDNMNNGVFCFDLNKNCIYSNKTAKQFFPSLEELNRELTDILSQNKELVIRNINVIKNGVKCTLAEDFQVLKDSSDKKLGYCLRFSDISDKLKAINEEHYRSTHDLLTGLYNRETFFQEAERIINQAPETKRYFIVTNLKNFKLVNDLYGSDFGDEILKIQARSLKKAEYDECVFGRISGDKFAMLIKKQDFDLEKAKANTEIIQKYVENVNYRLHIFVGIYEISDPYEPITSMYDKACLAIKSINENYALTLAFYDTELVNALRESKNIVAAFERSLNDQQFEMYLQPQIDAHTNKVIGAEALVRWNHPEKGILYPVSFIPTLEDTGFLHKLDRFIWTEAAKTLQKWKNQGIDKHIAVNISAKDFYYMDIYKFFTELVKEYDISPDRLKLEITETVLMHDLNTHKKILTKLRNQGFSIEMDDFGSGYSSMNMLKDIDMDILKIDMTFLRQTKHPQRSIMILESIIKMAKELKMRVIMEGVEEQSQADMLKKMGCDIFQGFLFSKALCVPEFENRYNGGSN